MRTTLFQKIFIFHTKFNIDAVQAIQSEATQKSHKRSDNSHTRLN